MKISTEELRLAFGLLDHVPQVDLLESSRFIKASATNKSIDLRMAGTLSGFAKVEVKDGINVQFHLDRNALSGFLRAVQGPEIVLQTGDKLILRQGRNKLEVAKPASVAGYTTPLNGKAEQMKVDEELLAILQTLQRYVPRKAVDERYSAVQGVKGFGWFAGDGQGMMVKPWPVKKDVVLPPILLEAAQGESDFLLYEGDAVAYRSDIGMLQQSLHADLKAFPRAKSMEVANAALAAKPVAEISLPVWKEALQYFQAFPIDAARLECIFGKKELLLRIVGIGLTAETTIPAKVITQAPVQHWDLDKLTPWTNSLDSKFVRLAVLENLTAFTTETKKDLLMVNRRTG